MYNNFPNLDRVTTILSRGRGKTWFPDWYMYLKKCQKKPWFRKNDIQFIKTNPAWFPNQENPTSLWPANIIRNWGQESPLLFVYKCVSHTVISDISVEFILDSSPSTRFNSFVTENIGIYIFKLLSLYFGKSEILARAFSSFPQKQIQTILKPIFCTEVEYITIWYFTRISVQ